MITMAARHTWLATAAGHPASAMTVVFDAGQNSAANFAHLADTRLHHVGSTKASDCPDLLGCPPTPAPWSTSTGSPG